VLPLPLPLHFAPFRSVGNYVLFFFFRFGQASTNLLTNQTKLSNLAERLHTHFFIEKAAGEWGWDRERGQNWSGSAVGIGIEWSGGGGGGAPYHVIIFAQANS